ncbi:MAG: LacI family transcriptional regulator [Treponema sp.]|jgi:LacI family transcriptional regulator|nr:LacI family transcriptional regulator [Treponema sp.]
MGITTKEIARICEVSRTTVDRALKGKGRISPVTKEKILSVANERGYRPDLLARSLITGKTMHIGVCVFDIRNYYFAEMLNSIENRAYEKGYFVNINLQEEDREKEIRIIDGMVDHRVDGIILCPVNKGAEFEKYLLSIPVPVVVIGNYISGRIPFVGINEKQAAYDAVDTLIKKSYSRIVFVCPPLAFGNSKNIYSHEQRLSGFQERLALEKNIDSAVIADMDYINSLNSLKNELSYGDRKTALFCSGDVYALNILKYFHKSGVGVPRDIGIMGFDNIHILEFVFPQLSTVSNAVEQVAVTAVDSLIKRMNGEEPENKIILKHRVLLGSTI